ncbi:hydroxyacid-oxoacid transhydrogenase [Natrarchaeobaculum aegyptiacum]|uniref:hydroxyacid-oxoacid transhydrogenase n=1 Tax=Natrarchaeobaculum aegyptiacum TaxID=745377 RepID=A0A2Z2HWD5_9EURY|nr:hydroxyacid-oxoacid transhydrogenase [Natrarchaeobaculum aegyptiacum]ARS91482.1 alcohol dehydrogenase [Natrarchaeobaculum aegyptiacum]
MTGGYDRTVSADDHGLGPETVWEIQLPAIRFGRNAVEELDYQLGELGVEAEASGLIVTDEPMVQVGHVDRVSDHLEDAGYDITVWDGAEPEPSIETVDSCLEFVRENEGEDGYDFYLGMGGGSSLDVAKGTRAVMANGGEVLDYVAEPTGGGKALTESGDPLILVPTTAGTGSEISPVAIYAVEEKDIKEGISSNHVRADAAVLDPTLTTTMPAAVTASTGMDALAHALEGYTTHAYDSFLRAEDPAQRPVYAGQTAVTEMYGQRAIELVANNLRTAVHNGEDVEARGAMLKASLFGAICGLTAGVSLCHAMAYPVGNKYHTSHGETIAVLTPATTLGYNVASDPERFAEIAALLGADTDGMSTRDAADEARREYVRLQQDLNVIPSGLAELAGVSEDEIDWLATQTVETQQRLLRCNPRPVAKDDALEVFREALHNWE